MVRADELAKKIEELEERVMVEEEKARRPAVSSTPQNPTVE